MRTRRRRHYQLVSEDSQIWLNFMMKCVPVYGPNAEVAAAASADVSLSEYRKRFPELPDEDEDEPAAPADTSTSTETGSQTKGDE